MKTIKLLTLLLISSLTFTSCSDSDDPVAVNDEEVITTMNVTLSNGGTNITLSSVDLDGPDGPNLPVITNGTLAANTTYTGSVEFLNETESPAEDITVEVKGEDEDHQIFFSSNDGSISFAYNDEDGNGNPIGIDFSITTGDAGSATMTVVLKHEPTKPNNGTTADAGGETDIEVTFDITVQ